MAAEFHLNPDRVNDLVAAAVATFDFTRPGNDQSLGRDLAVRVAKGISDRSNEGKGPDGENFKENEDVYARYKLARYDVDRPGELGGQTFSLLSCLGKPEVSSDEVVMNYGWGKTPDRSVARNGVALRPSELTATDREKAVHLTDSGRAFYQLDDAIAESCVELAYDSLAEHLKEHTS